MNKYRRKRVEFNHQTELICSFKAHSSTVGDDNVPCASQSGRNPEYLTPYFSLNHSRAINIFYCIPSQVNMAESYVEYHAGSKAPSLTSGKVKSCILLGIPAKASFPGSSLALSGK